MSELKSGDRVRVLRNGLSVPEGLIGTLVERDTFVKVKLDIREYPFFLVPTEYEIAKVKYTKLAEKIYPNGKREGDWWLL